MGVVDELADYPERLQPHPPLLIPHIEQSADNFVVVLADHERLAHFIRYIKAERVRKVATGISQA